MIWIVSKALINSETELANRHQIIQEISHAKVSPWSERSCKSNHWPYSPFAFFQCASDKGEYGVVLTAHMNIEVQPILKDVLTNKKALVVINSCEIRKSSKDECLRIIRDKNPQSEIFYARQELSDSGHPVNYMEYVGLFGFRSTVSERELFQNREIGLTKAIRKVYDKVVPE